MMLQFDYLLVFLLLQAHRVTTTMWYCFVQKCCGNRSCSNVELLRISKERQKAAISNIYISELSFHDASKLVQRVPIFYFELLKEPLLIFKEQVQSCNP